MTNVATRDGTLLWKHAWAQTGRIVQPALTAAGDVLISAGEGNGMRRLAVAHRTGGWAVKERWTSDRLKPYEQGEQGELALVEAVADRFTELARFPAIEGRRPGTTPCWPATSCWFATARRWPRSGCRSRVADEFQLA